MSEGGKIMGRKWEVGYKREMWMIGEDGDKSGEKKVVGTQEIRDQRTGGNGAD